MRTTILISAILLSSGCAGPREDWFGTCKIRPFIVTNSSGDTRWSDEILEGSFKYVNDVFKPTGLQFKMLPAIRMANDSIYELDGVGFDWLAMAHRTAVHARETGELAVFFVDSIDFALMDRAGGMAAMPSNLPGFNHGIAISATNRFTWHTLPHELGHSFNVPHPWEDNFTDTLQDYKEQGCEVQPCNVMNYCFRKYTTPGCLAETLTPQQITEIRRWATRGPRTSVVECRFIPEDNVELEYTNSSGPVVDPEEYD